HYQVNAGSVFTSNHSVYLNTLEETSIVADSTFDFDPTQNYQFKSWISVAADVDLSNDTLSGILQNTTSNSTSVGFPIYEDFSNSIPGTGFNNFGFQLISQWTTYGTQGGWRISDGNLANHSTNTAASSGMNGNNSNYAYLEASTISIVGTRIYLESPCLTIPNDTNVKFSFGYHKYGSNMGDLLIEVARNNGQWQAIDSIKGQTHNSPNAPWLKRTISFKDYVGQVIKIRFVGIWASCCAGDMAIDNILISSDTNFVDLSIDSLDIQSACYLSNQEQVSVNVHNYGDSSILPNSVTMHYQLDNQVVVSELIPDTIKKDSSYLFQFSQTVDLSQYNRNYNFQIYHSYDQDLNQSNDTLRSQVQNLTGTINFSEDFEDNLSFCQSHSSNLDFLPTSWNNFGSWYIQNDMACNFNSSNGSTESDSTGPASAHSGHGFAFFESSASSYGRLETKCFDFFNQSQITLEFYYHNYGRTMGNLIIQVVDSSGIYIDVDSIVGQTHFNNNSPWLKKTVNLSQFSNQRFKISFTAKKYISGFMSDMAIDDVRIYNPLTVNSENFEAAEKSLTLYPNPSKGQYIIQSEASLDGLNYQVYDLRGQLIQSGSFEGKRERLDLSTQPNGVYFLHLPELKLREKLVKY
ncbi:MAG: T9SS type A sorting domain-containing protein, partial [Vicingaceae bacterium]